VSLTILNNVASLTAENSLALTSTNLQKSLQQLSTGLKINSGADDAAGLSIATGLLANIAALVQSQNNANNGIGFLQVADGALSQVSGLLNRAVTLATEASSSGVTTQQLGSANAEYQSILSEINQIGANTQFNGTKVFTDGNTSPVTLTNSGTSISGAIDPADTLSGGFTLTSTVPGLPGTTTSVSSADSNGDSTSALITPGAILSGSLTVNSTVPGVSASTSNITLANNGDGTVSGVISPTDSLSGNLVISSTVPGTSATPTAINLSNSGSTTIVGNINPADTLSGGFTVTSTIPASGGVSSAISLTNNGTTITGTVAPADTLSGGFTVTSTAQTVGTGISAVTFSLTGTGSSEAITSSAITAGSTLSGSLMINSTGGGKAGSATLNLANYQNLSSSNAATATAAANQLATDLTNALSSTTYTSYAASISGGVLSIRSTTAGDSQSMGMTSSGNALVSSVPLVTGATLSGRVLISVGGSETDIQFSNYQGITSSNAATKSAALAQLGSAISSQLTGHTFTASINSSGALVIASSNASDVLTDYGTEIQTSSGLTAGEKITVGANAVEQTTASVGTNSSQISLTLTGTGASEVLQSSAITTGATLSGSLVINTTGSWYSGSTTLNLANYQGLSSSNATTATAAANQVATDLTNALWNTTHTAFSASISGGVLSLRSTSPGDSQTISLTGPGNSLTSAVSLVTGATLSGRVLISSGGSETDIQLSNYQGLTSSNAATKSAALAQLGTDISSQLTSHTYTASINASGKLVITSSYADDNLVDYGTEIQTPSGNTAGVHLSTGSGFLEQTYALAPVTSPATVSLSGVTTSNLQSSLQSALGSNYTVSYNTSSGALSIGISSTGASAHITSLAQSSNNAHQTTPVVAQANTPTTIDLSGITTSNLQSSLQSALGSNYTVAYNTTSGALSIFVSSTGAAAGITSITPSNNSAQQTGSGTSDVTTPHTIDITGQTGSNLQNYLSTQLGNDFTVAYDQNSGALSIAESWWGQIVDGIGSISGTSTAQETTAAIPAMTTPTSVNLSGVATANLQSYLQSHLGSDYAVAYDQNSGALSILLNSSNADGVTSFTSSSTIQQNVGSTASVNSPSNINLTGVSPTNLASSIVSQLGSAAGNYDVSYNTSSGALNIGVSSAGAAAGIASISANMSSLVETASAGTTGLSAFNVFTSDGTGSGTNVDVTVGSLSSAKVGASNGQAGVDLSTSNLLSQSAAASSLTMITAAVNGISSQRGSVGANINRLTATASVEGTTVVNLTSAMNSIQSADIGKTVANMTQYNVLQSTGMAALQQANQAQQAVLKLIQ
jgi:flagellin